MRCAERVYGKEHREFSEEMLLELNQRGLSG
jgi:hypothetical protein